MSAAGMICGCWLTMPSLLQALVKDVRVVVKGPRQPSASELAEHVAEALAWEPRVRCVLVAVSDGGALDARERAALAKAKLFSKPVAVLVSSPLTRGILTAVSWLGGSMAAFAPDALEQACRHLAIPNADKPAIAAQLETLRARLSAP